MAEQSDERPGIFASDIQAENVVSGAQVLGDVGTDSAQLVALAREIRSGRIDARQIRAQNVVSGLQYIKNPANATVPQLRNELAVLRRRLDEVVAAGEFEDGTESADAINALDAAQKELQANAGKGSRVIRKLAELTDIVTSVAERASRAGKAVSGVSALAPLVATVWQIAQRLLGG
jgi:hypothetical protein